jgi:hypothetical protein
MRSFLVDWVGSFCVLTLVSWLGLQAALVARPPARKALGCGATAAAIYVIAVSPILRYVFHLSPALPQVGFIGPGALLGVALWAGGLAVHIVVYWLIFSLCLDAYVKVRLDEEAQVTARSAVPAMLVWLFLRILLMR